MSKYQLVTLGKHIDILSGCAFPSSGFNQQNGVPLIRIRDILSGRTETYYEGSYDLKYLIKKGDLLVGMDGDFNREYWKGTDALLNQRVCKITSNPETLDKNFLYHFLQKELDKIHATTDVVTVKHLSVKKIQDIKIRLPSLKEQKRIAAILDKADGIRQKREQAIKLADDFLRSTYFDMFGDPIGNPKKFKKSPITELADIITGFAFKSNEYISDAPESVRLCRGANTLTGYFDWADTKFWPKNKLDKLDNYLINAGDIILAMDRPWISDGLKVCIFPENQRETYLVQRVARLRPRCEYYTNYIYSCIKSPAFEKHCCPTETTVPHISPVELKNFEVLIPPDELMIKFHSIVSIINNSLNKMASGDVDSDALFSKLSQQAFSGHLKR
ncbi:restriction endonuclease subunit S [Enterobacter sp. CP102]|nr:restriction endonuclease subunit S [Enterobacter sp. CP102]UWM64708.1 restriction endonuclease subunit S [Enterobacter sp. CP102]